MPRPEFTDQIRDRLLSDEVSQRGTLAISSIHGLGGIGKSVLAAHLTYASEVHERFPDGILWVTLGQTPDLLPLLGQWIYELGDQDYSPTTVEAASSYLRSLLADKTMLLVVDDLWDASHFEYFKLAGKGCRVLATTREVRLPNAAKFELDVMSLDQVITLVEKRLGAIAARDRAEFEAVAAAVGFLPLAIELAAAQVDDGLRWGEVLADLREEFDALDASCAEDTTDEAVRRKLSLRACFQLSLRRLSADALARFAWLGVTPEDAAVPVAMVARLWQVSSGKARRLLKGLRDRSLLLDGAAGGFRLHDLLHDLAQGLLVAPVEGTVDGLPGLGLSVSAAHGMLLDRYFPESGCWADLEDDGYIHGRLTWHMERAGRVREIHQLIRRARGDGRNGWYEACEELGQLTIFVEDVARAWRLAEEVYGIIPTEPEGWEWQMWCAFVTVSLNSLVGNVPAELIAALVREGIWTEARGLAYAMHKVREFDRSWALSTLVADLSQPELVKKVLETAQGMSNSAEILASIVGHHPELFENPIEFADSITPEYCKALAFSYLTIHTPRLLPKALQLIGAIPTAWHQYETALSTLIDKVTPEFLEKTVHLILEIYDPSSRAKVLSKIANTFPELTSDALEMSRNIFDPYRRARALLPLTDKHPELVSECITLLKQTYSAQYRVEILLGLIDKYPEALSEALQLARKLPNHHQKSRSLLILANACPSLMPEALEASRRIADELSLVKALSSLASYSSDLLLEASQIARQISDINLKTMALTEIALHTPSLTSELLETAREITNEELKVSVIFSIASNLNSEFLSEATSIANSLGDPFQKFLALHSLSNIFTELLPRVIKVLDDIPSLFHRALVLAHLAGELPDLQLEVLQLVPKIPVEANRAWVLSMLAETLDVRLLSTALQLARNISRTSSKALALSSLATKLAPGILPEALQVIDQIDSESEKAQELKRLARSLEGSLNLDARQISLSLQNPHYRAQALSGFLEDKMSLWQDLEEQDQNLLRFLAPVARSDFLQNIPKLYPHLQRLGGQPAVDATLQALRDACQQWA